ncbi:phage tail assembly chaperone [Pseudomonas extremaustralis]
MRYYSKETGCTYLPGIHDADMPPDAVPISEETFRAIIAGPTPGKVRSHDADGLPILIEPPPAAAEQLSAEGRAWRDSRLSASQWLIDRQRDQVEAGFPLTLGADQYSELMTYRQALRDWPLAADFPQDQSRPVPPAWLAEAENGA